MRIEVNPKKYKIVFGWEKEDNVSFDECNNTLELSEGQFQSLLRQMFSIAHNEGWLKTIAEEITGNPIEENCFEKYKYYLNKDFNNKIKEDYIS